MLRKLVILLLLNNLICYSQAPKTSFPEFVWACCHPVAAIKVKKVTKKCNAIYFSQPSIKLKLDSFSNGGKLDAFRHTFFMAAYAQKIKTKKLRKLGKAHEKANYLQFLKAKTEDGEAPDSLGSVMDLRNNELGLSIGSSHKKIPLEELREQVISEIKQGKALIMKRDKTGDYLNCEGKRIQLNDYRKKWFVPKCLVLSV